MHNEAEDARLRRLQEMVANSIQKSNQVLSGPDVRNTLPSIQAQFASIPNTAAAAGATTYSSVGYPLPSSSTTSAAAITGTTTAYRSNPWDEKNIALITPPYSSVDPLDVNRFISTNAAQNSYASSDLLPITNNRSSHDIPIGGSPYKSVSGTIKSNNNYSLSPIQSHARAPLSQFNYQTNAVDAADITNTYSNNKNKVRFSESDEAIKRASRNSQIPSQSYSNTNTYDEVLPMKTNTSNYTSSLPLTSIQNYTGAAAAGTTNKSKEPTSTDRSSEYVPTSKQNYSYTYTEPAQEPYTYNPSEKKSTQPVQYTSAPMTRPTYASNAPASIYPLSSYSSNNAYKQPLQLPQQSYKPLPQSSFSMLGTSPTAAGLLGRASSVDVYSTKWEAIIDRGEREKVLFSDSEFLPVPASIGGNYPVAVEWQRARTFINEGISMFGTNDEIDPTIIISGDLNNTYFQGIVSALAERTSNILNLFHTKKINTAGCYVLNICWKGVMTPVIVDDYFPLKSEKNQRNLLPCFTRSATRNDIWLLLLEKAWAKLHGSYAKIDAGLPREVLHDFTGAPTRTFFITGQDAISKQQLWERIEHADSQDLIAVVSLMEDVLTKEQVQIGDLYGINNTHLYTVLGTISVVVASNEHRFIKLRNPRCRSEWPIDSVDRYLEQMPEELIHALSYGGRCSNAGYFLMEFDDFRRFFSDFTICYSYEGFVYTGEKVCTIRGQNNYFKIEITTPGYYFFQLSQDSIRKEKIAEQMYLSERKYYSQCHLAIASESAQDSILFAVSGNQRDLTSVSALENPVLLPAGKYLVFIRVDWRSYQSSSGNLGFGVYGCSPVQIRASSAQHCQRFSATMEKQISLTNKWEYI